MISGNILSYYIQTWHDGIDMAIIIKAHVRFDDLDLDLDFENVL